MAVDDLALHLLGEELVKSIQMNNKRLAGMVYYHIELYVGNKVSQELIYDARHYDLCTKIFKEYISDMLKR